MRRVRGTNNSLVLHETLLIPVLMYGGETTTQKEERSRIRVVKMENIRVLLGIRRMDRVPNAWIKELCGLVKGEDKRINESVLRWFSQLERMEKSM